MFLRDKSNDSMLIEPSALFNRYCNIPSDIENDDFGSIVPSINEVMQEYKKAYLKMKETLHDKETFQYPEKCFIDPALVASHDLRKTYENVTARAAEIPQLRYIQQIGWICDDTTKIAQDWFTKFLVLCDSPNEAETFSLNGNYTEAKTALFVVQDSSAILNVNSQAIQTIQEALETTPLIHLTNNYNDHPYEEFWEEWQYHNSTGWSQIPEYPPASLALTLECLSINDWKAMGKYALSENGGKNVDQIRTYMILNNIWLDCDELFEAFRWIRTCTMKYIVQYVIRGDLEVRGTCLEGLDRFYIRRYLEYFSWVSAYLMNSANISNGPRVEYIGLWPKNTLWALEEEEIDATASLY